MICFYLFREFRKKSIMITKNLYLYLLLIVSFSCTESVPEIPKSSAKEITNPTIPIPNATSVFDSGTNTYTYTVPANTNIKAIAFNFSLPAGATSVPAPGSVQDFSNPVKYTITAEDKTTVSFTVIVKIEKSSEKKILSFIESSLVGNVEIDQSALTIKGVVSTSANLAKIKPTLTISPQAKVSPNSGVEIDFNFPVIYTVTAEDGTETKYTVTLTKQLGIGSSDSNIGSAFIDNNNPTLVFLEGKIDNVNKIVRFKYPAERDFSKIKLSIKANHPKATVSPSTESTSGGVIFDLTKPIQFKVTAENGSFSIYTVSVEEGAPFEYLGSFEKNLEGIRAMISLKLNVSIPKINRIYLWNRASSIGAPVTILNNTSVNELINDKTINDLYAIKNFKQYSNYQKDNIFAKSNEASVYPIRPSQEINTPDWYWTFSAKTLFIIDDSKPLITGPFEGLRVNTSYGVTLGKGAIFKSPSGEDYPGTDNFISIGWENK
jgi:hypothetical protein